MRFSIVFLSSVTLIFLSGCVSRLGGSQPNTPAANTPISQGPIASGNWVWVDFVIRVPEHENIIRNTTIANTGTDQKIPLILDAAVLKPIAIRIDDTATGMPLDIKKLLIGKNVGESITATVPPSIEKQANYDKTARQSFPGQLFDSAGISQKIGDIRVLDKVRGVLTEIRGDRPDHQYIFDTNPWDTYKTMEYTVTVRQIGGTMK